MKQERQMKFYKIQALYVPSFKNKPSEKYLIKIIGTEKAFRSSIISSSDLHSNADRHHQTSKTKATGVNDHICKNEIQIATIGEKWPPESNLKICQ